jgi:hypothetical protein
LRNLILNSEDVCHIAVVSFCPKMSSRFRLDQLAGNPDPLASFSDTALEEISNTKLARHLFHINRAPFVHEARIPGDDKEPAVMRKRGYDVFCYAIRKIFLLGISTHIGEGENGY